jgi:hypothetical protein
VAESWCEPEALIPSRPSEPLTTRSHDLLIETLFPSKRASPVSSAWCLTKISPADVEHDG